jgi:hypothetical protein
MRCRPSQTRARGHAAADSQPGGVFRAWFDVAAVPWLWCDAVNAKSLPPPPPPSRSFFACLSQPPRFLSFCQNKARRRAALRPQFAQRALCMPTALQQQLAAVFIPSACPSQASPPPPPPAPSNINASRMFLLTQRAPPVQCAFSPQLLRSAVGILHRARGILFRATATAQRSAAQRVRFTYAAISPQPEKLARGIEQRARG